MKKTALLLLILFILLPFAQQNARGGDIKEAFISMPDSLMPMLSQNTRKDLVDICISGMTTALENEWNGRSSLNKITNNYLFLTEDIADSVTTEMALLSKGKTSIICLVRTLRLPQRDSEIFLYSSQWKPLEIGRFFTMPAEQDFFASSSDKSTSPSDACYTFIRMVPSSDGKLILETSIEPNNGLSDPLGREKPRLQTIRYQWNGNKFIRL